MLIFECSDIDSNNKKIIITSDIISAIKLYMNQFTFPPEIINKLYNVEDIMIDKEAMMWFINK